MKNWEPGYCIFCGQFVTSCREEAGAPDSTEETDPCWATEDGDFGCDLNPISDENGCGDHHLSTDPFIREAVKTAYLK